MSHSFLTPTKVIRAAMAEFQNNLSFVKQCKKLAMKDYEIGGMKAGSAINAAVPNNFAVTTASATFSGQDLNERSVSVPVDNQYHVDLNGISTLEWTMNIDDFSQRFLKPAMSNLAAKVEQKMLDIAAKGAGSYAGAAATTPNTALVYLQAGQKLTELSAPLDGRSVHINPAANAATVDALKALFADQRQLGAQYTKGLMGNAFGFDFYTNQAIPVIACGTRTASSSVTVKTTVSTEGATTIVLSGTTGCTYTAGDMFTIADVYAVNPLTKQSTGALAQFVVTALATAGTTGTYDATVTVKTPMYSTGGHQNISAFPQATAAVTFLGTASTSYPRNIYTCQDAVAFANVELQVPGGVDFAAAETVEGISLRVVRYYTGSSDTISTRFDVAFGGAVLRPEWVGQLIG